MQVKPRVVVKIAGESGMGINSAGELFTKALKNVGLNVFGYREYPSLIEGGTASYQVDIAYQEINSSYKSVDLLLCISRESVFEYLSSLKSGGTLIHNSVRLNFNAEQKSYIEQNGIKIVFIDTEELIKQNYGVKIMSNMIMLGCAWYLLGLKTESLQLQIEEAFKEKQKYIKINQKMVQIGYDFAQENKLVLPLSIEIRDNVNSLKDAFIISGNHAIALGSVHAGVRAYYSYPMTPASSILSYMAEISHETGVLIKQAEDEITAAQMSLGSMFMGTRAFTSTSGGGFDLMTETVSLSGISETPMVVVLAQRPGPATGLPTWTGAGDLDLAVYSGHGEYPKCVIAVSNAQDAYELTQKAFNLAEKFQIPVIVLTEKQIAESIFLVKKFNDIEIERNLVSIDEGVIDEKRFSLKETISKRWLPGSSDSYYLANSDEHNEIGDSIEDAEMAKLMMEKRMKKMSLLKSSLPDPEYFGDPKADDIVVGWGSVKNTVLDCLPEKGVGYLHYSYVFPIRTDKLENLYKAGKKIHLVENNYTGQLGKLITQNSEVKFTKKLLKYDGRPFFIEEVNDFFNELKKSL
jgi:2-oxoglutarate ferredoxin oxidoreductase subunit alpha